MKWFKKIRGYYSKHCTHTIVPKVYDVSIVKDQVETTLKIDDKYQQIIIPVTKEMLDALNREESDEE